MSRSGNDITQIDSVPPTEAYVLYGAVIGGPDYQDRMFDIRSDYPETEIALDYNAPMLAISAYHVATDVNDPFYVQIAAGTKVTPSGRPTDAAFPGGRSGSGNSLSQGAKIAIGVVVTVVGLVIVGLVWRWLHLARKYKR
jgi:endoglucanase